MIYRAAVFILGLVIGAYWARVLRMARKFCRKTGRAANLLPPEPLGRVLRAIWGPLVVVWAAHPFVTSIAFPRNTILHPLIATGWIAWPATLLAAAGYWASRICWRAMGKNWRMGIDPAERTGLVVAGPYAYVRHPIYALSQGMMLASMLAIPSPLMLFAGLLHILLLQWEARREERHMIATHGEGYAAYCARVGRFIPGWA